MNTLNIHDIKGLESIPDISFYIYILLLILGLAFLCVLIFLIFGYLKKQKKNERKEYFQILKSINLEEAKTSAYTITKYSRLLARNDREKRICSELIEVLDEFKYKKEVKPLSEEVKTLLERFMDIVDV
jgi:hypothetical protein